MGSSYQGWHMWHFILTRWKKVFQKGEKNLLLRQLSKRFGKLGDVYITSINSLTIAQLEDLGEALLDFGDINDLEQWLKSHTES